MATCVTHNTTKQTDLYVGELLVPLLQVDTLDGDLCDRCIVVRQVYGGYALVSVTWQHNVSPFSCFRQHRLT